MLRVLSRTARTEDECSKVSVLPLAVSLVGPSPVDPSVFLKFVNGDGRQESLGLTWEGFEGSRHPSYQWTCLVLLSTLGRVHLPGPLLPDLDPHTSDQGGERPHVAVPVVVPLPTPVPVLSTESRSRP